MFGDAMEQVGPHNMTSQKSLEPQAGYNRTLTLHLSNSIKAKTRNAESDIGSVHVPAKTLGNNTLADGYYRDTAILKGSGDACLLHFRLAHQMGLGMLLLPRGEIDREELRQQLVVLRPQLPLLGGRHVPDKVRLILGYSTKCQGGHLVVACRSA